MKLSDTIKSKYFKTSDIPNAEQGGHVVVTIGGFEEGTYEDGRPSLEMQLQGMEKSLGLNVTNRKRLMMIFGKDVELHEMVGRQVDLYAEITQDRQGNPCYGVRIRQPQTPSDRPPTPVQTEPASVQEQPPPPSDADIQAAFPDARDAAEQDIPF